MAIIRTLLSLAFGWFLAGTCFTGVGVFNNVVTNVAVMLFLALGIIYCTFTDK